MKKLLSILCFALPLFCMAQQPLPRQYDYDAAGNRIIRKVLNIQPVPPAPSDSTQLLSIETENPNSLTPSNSLTPDYFLEEIDRKTIKIYPNPATEVVTLEISQWQNLQNGSFKLYSLSGQLLQEHPVQSAATLISLSGLAKGSYILKVNINNHLEEWKIIKQ